MQLLYFCMLLTAVAIPTLPMLMRDNLFSGLVACCLPFESSAFSSLRDDPFYPIIAMLLLTAGFGFASKWIEFRLNASLAAGAVPREVAESHVFQKRVLQWFWVLVSPICLAVIGWGGVPRRLIPSIDSMGWSLVVCILPSLLMVALVDSQSHRWRSSLISKLTARGENLRAQSWIWAFWTDVRQTWLLVFAMPVVACSAIDLGTAISHGWHLNIWLQLGLGAVLVSLIVLVVPYAMLWCWSVEPLEGIPDDCSAISVARVTWIKELWSQNSPSPRVLYWSTNHRLSCAMVVGWLAPFRCLVLSDALMDRLNDTQLRMVVLHEAAHVRRLHIWIRFIPVLIGTLTLAIWFQPVIYSMLRENIPGYAIGLHGLATLVGMVVLLKFISSVAKWTEFEADIHAIELSIMHDTWAKKPAFARLFPENQDSAKLDRFDLELKSEPASRQAINPRESARGMIQALERIVPVSLHSSGGWLHPSVDERRLRIVQRYFKDVPSMVESTKSVTQPLLPIQPQSFDSPSSIASSTGAGSI